MPPVVRPPTNRELRLESVDRGVKSWFEEYVAGTVQTPEGEVRKIAVIFSSGERWVAATDQRGIRDRDGRLILPVVSIKRTGIDPVNNMTALGANVPTLQISRRVADKRSQIANLDLTRPISQRRMHNRAAVHDIYTIPFPFNGTLHYQAVIQAQYTHHMNEIVEKIVSGLEFFDVPSFVFDVEHGTDPEPAIKDGKGSTELSSPQHAEFELRPPLDRYYFVGYFDGDFGDSGNFDEFTDQERIVETKFTFKVPVALMLDPAGNRPAVQKQTTAFAVTLGDELSISVDDPGELDLIFGPLK